MSTELKQNNTNIKSLWNNSRLFRFTTYIFGGLFVHKIYCILHRKIHNYPPGNYHGLPLIGSFGWMLLYGPQKYVDKMMQSGDKKKHISMYYQFGTPIVLLNESKLNRKYQKQITTKESFHLFNNFVKPFATENGDEWKKRRLFISNSFNTIMSTKKLNKGIQKILQNNVFPKWDKICENNELYDLRDDIQYMAFIFIFESLFGGLKNIQTPTINNEDYKKMISNLTFQTKHLPLIIMEHSIFHGKVTHFQKKYSLDILCGVILKWCNEWKNEYNNTDIDSVGDVHMKRAMNKINNGDISLEQCCSDMSFLFIAGLHATLISLEMIIWYSMIFKKEYNAVYNELDKYFNKKNQNSVINEIRKQCPLFRAFVRETIRFCCASNQTFRLNQSDNLIINEYNIPNGAIITQNYDYFNKKDKFVWEKPKTFNLTHWLNDKGEFDQSKNIQDVTFGFGPRECIGKNLALRELHSALPIILHKYQFEYDKNDPDWKAIPMVVFVQSKRRKVRIKLRKQ
eukprot:363779_1